jgi:hypothetical protein
MRHRAALLLVLLLLCAGNSRGQPSLDSYGGWTELRSIATGWFYVTKLEGRWWFVDPDGNAFLSLGVNDVDLSPDAAPTPSYYREAALRKHRTRREWASAAVRRLRTWGFNTVGAGSDRITWEQGLPHTASLDLSAPSRRQADGAFPDVFAPRFQRDAQSIARRTCRPLATDPLLIGYFTDDELPWGATSADIFAQFLGLGDRTPGRIALLTFLEDRYLQIEELNQAWGTDYTSFQEIGRLPQVGAALPADDQDGFLRLVAERYFTVAQQAIRAVDTNHLLLGCRFADPPPPAVLQAMVGRVDVISLRGYGKLPPVAALREIHRLSQRPILITAFTSGARDASASDARGRGPIVDTQRDRGEHYARYLREALTLPMVIGCHWEAYADAVAEESRRENCGLVDREDEPYSDFVAVLAVANEQAYTHHAGPKPSRKVTATR